MTLTEPGSDEFAGEKVAFEIESGLGDALRSGKSPVATEARGVSPAPMRYEAIGQGVAKAVFSGDRDVAAGWSKWRQDLGAIRYARFYVLPGNLVRYDIRSESKGRLEHRIGNWKVEWAAGKIVRLEPAEETLTFGDTPWFRDVTAHVFGNEPSFAEQLARGVPYWRARLDPACGIDVYGENGIAAADIDGDGRDEIYVCQPGGLPNRLYKFDAGGRVRDVSREAGLDILDDTASALFVDLRNSGAQDLVLVRSSGPMLFINDGKGRFTLVEDAFRFRTPPQGSFAGVSAADFDRDGRLDLYFCCYVYFQSEAQYRYPVPYHDARNGPPNFLFRNRLNEKPGYFEDVTAATAVDQNNTHFSFAAAWCDYNDDGWPDLYVTNDFGRKNLYRNDKGRFRDVADEAKVTDLGPGMSAAWFDYDGDGRADLLVSNMWSACGQRIVNDPAFGPVKKDPSLLPAYRSHVKGNSLYRNCGDGSFEYTGESQGIEICPWSWSCDGADFDNDGSPEIYVACGMVANNSRTDLMSYFYRQVVSKSPPKQEPAPEYENGWNAINQLIRQDFSWAGPEPNVFFARRSGRYYDFSGVSGIDKAEDSRAFALVDIEGDGNLDLVLKSRMGPQVRVFQNVCGASRKSVVFSLRGTKSNRDAIGARVRADGQTKWTVAGSGYLSQHTKRLHFGLGEKDRVEKVEVRWPSGDVQHFGPLDAGYLYDVVEGSVELTKRPLTPRKEIPAGGGLNADNRARLHSTWFWEPVPIPVKVKGPALLVLHAGESLPTWTVPVSPIDLRKAATDTAAAFAIFRRYLFDYRIDLETPLCMLIDGESRVRRIYAEPPDEGAVATDLRSLTTGAHDPRGLPFEGRYLSAPRRDYYKIGGALLMAGCSEHALPYLLEMLRRNPDDSKVLFAVGRVHLEAKRLAEARATLERVVALSPKMAEGWNELGGVEAEAGNHAGALRMYEKALTIQPASTYTLVNIAQTKAALGDKAEAESVFRRVLRIDSRNGDAANGLGLLLAKQGRTDEARKLFEQAISIRRDDSSAINNLAVLYMNIGQVNDAVSAFQYGIQVVPDDELLYMNLARIWVQSGNRDRAREVLRQLLERKPDNAAAQRAMRALEAP